MSRLSSYLIASFIAVLAITLLSGGFNRSEKDRRNTPGQSVAQGVNEQGSLVVFAAASLGGVMNSLAEEFERQHGTRVTIALAGSSVLARQIEHGAPADIYLSANTAWMDRLEEKKLLQANSRYDLLSNRLVLIQHGSNISPIENSNYEQTKQQVLLAKNVIERVGQDRIAMALVDAVPAGIYAKAALSSLGIWSTVESRVVQSDNVRAALSLVVTGEARFGLVYLSDALSEQRVSIVAEIPPQLHPEIIYTIAHLSRSRHTQALPFLRYLKNKDAQNQFEHHGFIVMGQ